jgi:acid phosphatase
MNDSSAARGYTLGAVGLAVGLLVGYSARDGAPRPNPLQRALDANLWMQTSGEYHALCLQTYRSAGEKLQSHLATLRRNARGETRPAVVMDLDETVFDNSPFETWLYQYQLDYSDPLWEVWERDHPDEVRLVPGVREFIRSAERAGVTVVYISNRMEKHRAATVRALEHLGLRTAGIGPRLLLKTGGSDKTQRRRQAEARYHVMMYFGDNLRDFSEEFKAPRLAGDDVPGQNAAIAARKRKVDARRGRWGEDWFVLPNPVYGEWQKLAGRRPLENLNPTTMKPPTGPGL